MQRILLMGNLGKDPEEKTTQNGKTVLAFSLAVTPRKNQTVWYECSIWEEKLPIFKGIIPYLKKGARVLVGGEFKTPHPYQAKDGTVKVQLRMEPSFITFTGGGEKKEENTSKPKAEPSVFDEEIPF